MKYGLAGCRDTRAGQRAVAGSGHAAGTCTKWALALFQGGKTENSSPDFPNGVADVTFGCWGLAELPRGTEAGHSGVTGLSGTPVLYHHPKGTYNGLWCPPGGDQLPVPFLTQKGTMDGTAAPQGHLCPVSSPRHLALTGINSTQLHRSGPFQGHDPITLVLPRALPELAYRWMHGPQHHLCTRNLNQLPAAK